MRKQSPLAILLTVTFIAGAILGARPVGVHAAPPPPRRLGGQTPDVVAHGRAYLRGRHNAGAVLTLDIGLRAHNTAALDALIAAASDPASPQYGHYLTRRQYKDQFAPTDAEAQAVRDWASGAGLRVEQVSPDNLLVTVRGTAGVVERALGVTLNDYSANGKDFTSNDRDATVPANLDVGAISGLSTLHRFHVMATPAPVAPDNLRGSGYYFPQDFRAAYTMAPVGDGTGGGQTIGLTLWGTAVAQSDLDAFATNTGTTRLVGGQAGANGVDWIYTNGVSSDTHELMETAMDVEYAHGVAPGVHLKYWLGDCTYNSVSGNCEPSDVGLESAISAAANDPTLHAVSNSWGGGEATSVSDPFVLNTDASFQYAASVGTTFYFSSGDGGKGSGCDTTANPGCTAAPSYPADDPYVVSIGGTHLTTNADGSYGSENAWSGSGGGCSTVFARPSWQTGVGAATCAGRAEPDVSADADPNSGAYVYKQGGGYIVGGTSLAAPLWAGMSAIMNQYLGGSGMGFAAPRIYQLANTATTYARDFHDVTSGNNGFPAGTGWDEATGWGAPNLANLATDWAPASGTASLTTTSTPPSIPTASATSTPTNTATATNTSTVTPTATATNTPAPTNTATPAPTNTATNTSTATATNTLTATSTSTMAPTATATSTMAPTPMATNTATATPPSLPATGDGSPGDGNIAYFGRWDKSSSSVYKSYWAGAYFKTSFSGTTVKIKLAAPVNLYVSIDNGADVYYSAITGTVNLTPVSLSAGIHTLRVAAPSELDVIQFQGLVLDAGASTVAASTGSGIIEFVGDSITAGYHDSKLALSDYAWLAAEQIGAEHTQIAYSGICLVDNIPCFSPNSIGISRQFFKTQTVDYPNSPDWDFSRYQPSTVVINIGQNDQAFNVPDATFQSVYTSFLQNVRAKYPNARIYVLRPFSGAKAAPAQAAVNARIGAGDTNIAYIDTTGWLSPGDYIDGVHPSDSGQLKAANDLVPILEGTPPATSTPVPTVTPPLPTSTLPAILSSTSTPTVTNKAVPTATSTTVPTSTNPPVPTNTAITAPPTATSTAVPSATNTPVPSGAPSSPTLPANPTSTNTAVAPTATSVTYKASAGFSATQGQNGWRYQYWTGSSYSDLPAYNTNIIPAGAWGLPGDTYCLVWANGQHPGSTNCDSARTWIAPGAGTIQVTGSVSKSNISCGDGVVAHLIRNTDQAHPLFTAILAYNDSVGVSMTVSTSVVAGDALHFQLNRGGNNYCDGTSWDPQIVFTPTS